MILASKTPVLNNGLGNSVSCGHDMGVPPSLEVNNGRVVVPQYLSCVVFLALVAPR
jgi:hypothetical protein